MAAGVRLSHRGGRVTRNVVALGAVSMVTDVSSEMVTAVLPAYLLLGLGLSPLGIGMVTGLYTGATALVRLIGGHLADRTQARKAIAVAGYGLSAICKPALLLAGSSVGAISAVIGVDRIGKGLRTAPRDALISLSSDEDSLGGAFGVHRAMDTLGALSGPLVAFAVLAAAPGRYDAVFVTSACIAAAGVVLLLLFVSDRRGTLDVKAASIGRAVGLLRDGNFRQVFLIATMLGLATIGDGFVYLVLQRRLDIAIGYFPLLPLGTNAVYVLLAFPLGRLGDRIGRVRVFLLGVLALTGAYLALVSALAAWWLLAPTLLLYGAFYAATDGVLMAIAAPLVPPELRTSGLALVQTGAAGTATVSAVAFGALWSIGGPDPALWAAAAVAAIAALGVLGALRKGAMRPAGQKP
jgi:MFS family permease